MWFIKFIGWVCLRFRNPEKVTVIERTSINLSDLKQAVSDRWPGGLHFAYIVEKNPGDKWFPYEYQEEYVLGLFHSAQSVGRAMETITDRLIRERTERKDLYISPNWICVLIL